MSDFTLAISRCPSGFLLTARGASQVTQMLAAPHGLVGVQAGHRLYQQVFSGSVLAAYQMSEPRRVLIYGPEEVLDWPWQQLHDGVRPLALRHPLVLLPAACQQVPAGGEEEEGEGEGPLRILLTMTADRQHAALGVAIDRWIDQLERRSAGQVLVRRVRVTAGYQQLLRVFRQVLSPFHLWQHVGPCAPGLDLELGKERVQVCDLNMLLAEQPAACCMVLATHAQAPPASVLSQLQAPFVLWQSARPGRAEDLELLHGFYTRLLTHDLAVAATLGQLETCTQGGSEGVGGSLSLLARTTHLFAGPPRLARLRRPRTQAQAQLPRATLLVLKANPPVEMSAMVGLRIEQEVNQIRGVLRENSGMVDLREAGAVRLPDLSRYLQRYLPVLLHFSGHGTPEEELVLEKYTSPEELQGGMYLSAVEAAAYVAYVDIARILVAYSATLRCVVFNACSTESLAEAICLQIPCAIGMRGPINDFLAIRFAEIFYRSLAAGESVGLAFRKAHSDILSGPHAKRAEIFQLKSRSGVNPDEIFLVAGRGGRV